MAKMASLFAMTIQQLTRQPKTPGLPVSHLRCWNTGKSPVRLSSTLKLARKGGHIVSTVMPGLESESPIIPTVVALPESNRSPLPLGGVSGVPTLIQSRCGNKGNFELLTPMASGGLAHYWRNNDDPFVPWFGPIRFGQEAGRL